MATLVNVLGQTGYPVVVNQPSSFLVQVSNTGGSAVTISAISVSVSPGGTAVSNGYVSIGPNMNAQVTDTTGVNYYPFELTFFDPRITNQQSLNPPMPSPIHSVIATVSFSDGTQSVSPIFTVDVNGAHNVPPGSAIRSADGQFRFDSGFDSVNIVLISPP